MNKIGVVYLGRVKRQGGYHKTYKVGQTGNLIMREYQLQREADYGEKYNMLTYHTLQNDSTANRLLYESAVRCAFASIMQNSKTDKLVGDISENKAIEVFNAVVSATEKFEAELKAIAQTIQKIIARGQLLALSLARVQGFQISISKGAGANSRAHLRPCSKYRPAGGRRLSQRAEFQMKLPVAFL